MAKLHLAIATKDIAKTVEDYTTRLKCAPCLVINDEYALWRTDTLNVSIRADKNCKAGELRHLGWEEEDVEQFSMDSDVNGIVWESFTAHQQAEEIKSVWPHVNYIPE